MAYSIIVKVSELRSRIQDIRRDGNEYVEISISDPDEIDGDALPACLNFSGCKASDPNTWVDYDEVEAVENEETLKASSLEAIHMSSNLL